MKILQLNTSIRGTDSVSTKFANAIADKLKNTQNAQIIVRDLAQKPVSQLDNDSLGALFSGNLAHPVIAEHTDLINEIKEVDTLILGVPMYNFGIPVTLKNYFDAISRAGVTFKYTETGPIGLLNINKAYVVLSRGGMYRDKGDFSSQEDFLATILKFLGIKEVEFIFLEGLNMGENIANQSISQAHETIENLQYN